MGFSKARLSLPDGTLLLQHKLNLLEPFVAEIILAGAPDRSLPELSSSKLTIVYDQKAYTGPLEGFYSLFQAVKTPYLFITACDMPYFSCPLLEALYQVARKENRAVVPLNESGPVYLFSIFPVSLLKPLEELRKTTTALKSLAQILDIHWFEPEKWLKFDPEGRFYQNLNFPEDYQRFLQETV